MYAILSWSLSHETFVLVFKDAGKSTGVVTTTRITHASPSGTYAHIANRDWENDAEIQNSGQDPDICDDIAEQLVNRIPGKNIKVSICH
jgi:alkaline phosphatase